VGVNILEQRAGQLTKPIGAARRWSIIHSKTYWSSAQVGQKPIGAARRWSIIHSRTYWSSAQDLLEQRAGRSKTYWSSAQVEPNILEQRAGRFCNCLIFNIFSGFLHPYPFNLKHIQRRFSLRTTPKPSLFATL
jgi:hypothetical protein